MAYDEGVDRFILTLGRHGPPSWVDETLVLHLAESAAGRARYVFDRGESPEQPWSCDAATPAGTSVSFRFRSSEDATRFGAWSDECPPQGRFLQVEVTLHPGPDGSAPRVRSMGFRAPS